MEAPTDPSAIVLSLALQEGFDGDEVAVRVNGEEVLRRDDVTTDVRIGLAFTAGLDLGRLPAVVEVEVPTQSISGQTTLDGRGGTHLGVSAVDGAVRFRVSDQPFGYL